MGLEVDLVTQRPECPGRAPGHQKQGLRVIAGVVRRLQDHLGTFQPVLVSTPSGRQQDVLAGRQQPLGASPSLTGLSGIQTQLLPSTHSSFAEICQTTMPLRQSQDS